jgi:hypothetical protein
MLFFYDRSERTIGGADRRRIRPDVSWGGDFGRPVEDVGFIWLVAGEVERLVLKTLWAR